MQRRFLPAVFALLFLVIWLLPMVTRAQRTRCFAETGYCIEGVILTYWEQNGGLPVFGYPTTELRVETNNDGWTGPTQWFERDRLEDHGAEGVLAGRLGAGLLELQGRAWRDFPQVSDAPSGCRYFAVTGHSLCEPFKSYWEQNGGLERFGYPITEPFYATLDDWSGTIQYFERRRMEHHTELAGTRYEVLLGLLGNEVRAYASGRPEQPSVPPAYPAPSASPIVTSTPLPSPILPTPEVSPSPVPPTPTVSPSPILPTPTVSPSPVSPSPVPPTPTAATADYPTPGTCLTAQEAELARLVNAYRNTTGLPDVPISKSLTHVAQAHVLDLHDNEPDSGTDNRGEACNMHSWSDQGEWSPVCYTSDHANAAGMWSKPREITGNIYTGNGYEISYGFSGQADPSGALDAWQNSPGHNGVIIEQDGWGPWQAMGVAVYEHHAVVWFGEEVDPQGTIAVCQ